MPSCLQIIKAAEKSIRMILLHAQTSQITPIKLLRHAHAVHWRNIANSPP